MARGSRVRISFFLVNYRVGLTSWIVWRQAGSSRVPGTLMGQVGWRASLREAAQPMIDSKWASVRAYLDRYSIGSASGQAEEPGPFAHL